MKRYFILLLLFLVTIVITDGQEKSRKEIRSERNAKMVKEIKHYIDSKAFVFEALQANPLGGSTIHLTSPYDLKIKGDTAIAFLPYFGVAYRAEYGSTEGGIKFDEQMEDYKVIYKKQNYDITFKINTLKDNYSIHLTVSDSGYGTLNVTCVNRQFISFYGRIASPEEESGKI